MPQTKKHPLSQCKCGLAYAPPFDWTAVAGVCSRGYGFYTRCLKYVIALRKIICILWFIIILNSLEEPHPGKAQTVQRCPGQWKTSKKCSHGAGPELWIEHIKDQVRPIFLETMYDKLTVLKF